MLSVPYFFSQGLNEVNPALANFDESNAMALAIVPPGRLQNTQRNS